MQSILSIDWGRSKTKGEQNHQEGTWSLEIKFTIKTTP
jgi:hypothetical protein